MKDFSEYVSSAAVSLNLEEMRHWAYDWMQENPPVIIRDQETGRPYLQRWFVIPRNEKTNLYLHRFIGSDPGPDLHDHRGDNSSWVLDGEYDEVLPTGFVRYDKHGWIYESTIKVRRNPGDHVTRRAEDLHRVEVINGYPALSLFAIGPIFRDWGFRAAMSSWVPWRERLEIKE